MDATDAGKEICYSWHIFFIQDITLDDTGGIWLHLKQVFHEIVSGKSYIIQLDGIRAEKQIYYSWNIAFSQDIILDYSGRIWLHLQQVFHEIV